MQSISLSLSLLLLFPALIVSDVKSSRPDCPRGRNFVLGLDKLSSASSSSSDRHRDDTWWCVVIIKLKKNCPRVVFGLVILSSASASGVWPRSTSLLVVCPAVVPGMAFLFTLTTLIYAKSCAMFTAQR